MQARPLTLLDASISLKDKRVIKCGKMPIMCLFQHSDRNPEYYHITGQNIRSRIRKLTYLQLFNHVYVCVSNGKPWLQFIRNHFLAGLRYYYHIPNPDLSCLLFCLLLDVCLAGDRLPDQYRRYLV